MILQMYGDKDAAQGGRGHVPLADRGIRELATALGSGTQEELAGEMADVLAWLATLANIRGVNLEGAVLRKYGRGCPGCGKSLASVTRLEIHWRLWFHDRRP